ncbi:MAG: hypothetical protein DYH05_12950 [Acidobacteria bacterium ACB1]|nr:hypothetical protein [Acidobacteria bacterium ACB1]
MPASGELRAPVVKMGWSDGISQGSETYLGEYAMQLDFDETDGDYLPGRLYLCLPDSGKSYIAGKFAAKIEPSASPEGL